MAPGCVADAGQLEASAAGSSGAGILWHGHNQQIRRRHAADALPWAVAAAMLKPRISLKIVMLYSASMRSKVLGAASMTYCFHVHRNFGGDLMCSIVVFNHAVELEAQTA